MKKNCVIFLLTFATRIVKNSKHFVWSVCGEQIIRNLLSKNNNTVTYPVMVENEDYDFEYKGYKFKMFSKGVE